MLGLSGLSPSLLTSLLDGTIGSVLQSTGTCSSTLKRAAQVHRASKCKYTTAHQQFTFRSLAPKPGEPETGQVARKLLQVNTPPTGRCPHSGLHHSVLSLTMPTRTPRCCERKLTFCYFVFCDFIHRNQFLH